MTGFRVNLGVAPVFKAWKDVRAGLRGVRSRIGHRTFRRETDPLSLLAIEAGRFGDIALRGLLAARK